MSERLTLGWGRELVELLVPQREPLWMVDQVLGWEHTPQPTLRAARAIRSDEPVFAGHFPDQPVWPGIFTIEGLAQCCRILGTLEQLRAGADHAAVVTELSELGRALRGEPGADERAAEHGRIALRQLGGPGLLAATEMRFVRPVMPGCLLEYGTSIARVFDRLTRFEVEASVEAQLVARGTITTARLAPK